MPDFIGSKGVPGTNATARAHTWQPEIPLADFAEVVGTRGVQISQSELKSDGWRLLSPTVLRLLEKLRRAGKPLGEYVSGRLYWGVEYWQEFEQTKLFVPAIPGAVNVSLDREGFFSNNKTSIFVCDDPAFVLAIVNSKVAFWFTRQVFATKQGGFYDFEPRYCSQWPIPAVSSEKQKPVKRLVERILSAKQRDAGADVSALEREIDQQVYALYNLTPEEIRIVEEASR